MHNTHVTRRSFLETSAKATGGLTLLGAAGPVYSRPAGGGKVRIGVVGIGGRASGHINAFNELDNYDVTALCDISDAALQKGLDQVQGRKPKTYKRYADMLKQQVVDAVAIVTPNSIHKQQAIDALNAGKHVLCEKPMGITMEDCDEVVAVAKRSDAIIQYGMQLRHTPTFVKTNELVQSGAIGNIRYAWISDFRSDIKQLYEDPVVERTTNWRYFQNTSGGMLLEYSIHRLDLMNWWMASRPVMLSAFGGHNVWMDRETIDHCGMLIEYGNGAKATYGMSLYSLGYRSPWLLMGDGGQMLIERGGKVTIMQGDASNSYGGRKRETTQEVVDVSAAGNGTTLQYVHFAKAIHGEVRPYPDYRIAYDAMWVGIQGENAIQKETVFKY